MEHNTGAKKHLLVIGGGYAGFWSALSAIRQSRELHKADELEVTLINSDNYFTMRPRLYEVSLEGLRVELDKYLKPLGINQIIGRAETILPEQNEVLVSTSHGVRHLRYDYLILATGSSLKALNLPGIEHTFNNDTFNNALKLENHIIDLAKRNFENEGDTTFVVVGGGLTGLETVTFIEDKAKKMEAIYSSMKSKFKVLLVEKHTEVATFYGSAGQQYIIDTLKAKNIEVITDAEVVSVEPSAVFFKDGSWMPTSTVVWTVGMIASPLTNAFKGKKDSLNRLHVDTYLKLPGYDNVIIAGDVANVTVGKDRSAVMSCQFSQFQGRWAGHNAVNDIFGVELLEYKQPGYNTCLDLGSHHALITDGWNRLLKKTGHEAKAEKEWVCTDLIYPYDEVDEALADSKPFIPKF